MSQDKLSDEYVEVSQFYQDLKKHLKMQSKNELIATVIDLTNVIIENLRINKALNEKLKNQGDSGDKVSPNNPSDASDNQLRASE